MFWNNPGLIWLALTLPAILALYILRTRRKQTMVPSTLLWRPAAADLEASRPWQRLRSRLLLWLQLLAAALLVLAAAGPVWLAPAASRSTIVLLDASASMRAAEGGRSRFDRARDEVVSLAEGLRGGATITVIAFDRKPRVLVRDSTDPGEVREALKGASPSACAGDPGPALSLAGAIARQIEDPRLVLVSDGGVDLPEDCPGLEFIPVGEGDASVAIASLDLRSAGDGQAAQVTVVNHGFREASGEVSLMAGSYPAGSRNWRLAPGQAGYFLWTGLPPEIAVSARIKPDRPEMDLLETDNQAWVAPAQKEKRKILLVSGGNVFLERALSLMPQAEVYLADISRYGLLLPGEYPYDLTVLDGLAEPMPPGPALLIDPPAGSPLPGITIGDPISRFEPDPVPESLLLKFVDLAGVYVRDARAAGTGAGWQADVKSGETTIIAHGEAEGGRVAVWSLDLHKSDLPLRPAFPLLLQNTVDWLSPPSLGMPSKLEPCDEVKIVAPPLAVAVSIEGADGALEKLAPPFPPSPWIPAEPGLYRVAVYREGGTATYPAAVSGYSPGEADLRVTGPRGGGAAGDLAGQAGTGTGKPLPLTQLLALAALLVIMLEWGVAGRGR